MTIRALVLGILGAMFIGATGYFNDIVMGQTPLYTSYMPLFIFGMLMIFAVTLNPLLRKIRPGAAFTGAELALAIAVMLPSCYISSRAFIHQFTGDRMAPRYLAPTQLGWQQRDLLDRTPEALIAGVRPEYDDDDMAAPVEVCRVLVGSDASAVPGLRALREALPVDVRTRMSGMLQGQPDADACAGEAADVLNELIQRPDLFTAADFETIALPRDAVRVFSGEPVQEIARRRTNRRLIDIALGERVVSWDAKEERAVRGFQMGLSTADEGIAIGEIPWYAWTGTLWWWIPMVIAFCAVFMGLGLVAHRRMSEHELYPYPIVAFAKALLPSSDGSIPGVLRDKRFWIASGVIALIHLNNYAFEYWPESLVSFPRFFSFETLSELATVFKRGGTSGVFHFTIFFTAIGLAYFMASDVSFSMGIAPAVYSLVAGVFAGYGISLSGGWYNSLRTDIFIAAGAYFGMFGIIVWTGRHHYAAVFRRGFFLRNPSDDVKPHEVLGARITIIASVAFILLSMAVGLNVVWATLYLLMLIMIFAPLGRIIAETGSFIIHPHVYPTVLLWGFLGARFVGTDQMLIMFMLGGVFALGMHMNVLPMFDHGLKLVDEKQPRRTASWAGAGVVLALLIAVPVAIYLQYDRGFMAASDGFTRGVPKFPYDPIVSIENRFSAQGVLDAASNWSLSPHWPGIVAFIVTLACIIGMEFIRLRVSWWPIHPILFICLGWWHSRALAISFLIGWAIKRLVTKYGGTKMYNEVRPVMFGVIAGDMLAGTIITIIGAIYYFVTDELPVATNIVPR